MPLRNNMTEDSNRENGESEQPEHDATWSTATPSKPVQLDLFEQQTGEGGQTQEPPAPSANPVATEAPSIFAHWAAVYRHHGYWPRPITLGTKACHVREWQKPDPELSDATLASWLTSHANLGVGLLMGSPFPDGTVLGALDIDHDEYVRLGRASLLDAPCGRVGRRGAAFFVRVRGDLGNPEFKVRGEAGQRYGKVVECLFAKKLCIIPPTIHPDIGHPYRWFGRPLHEFDFNELPIVEMNDA
jgi:Bifunctional DNA primase/polymerase, N-terminal